MESYCTNESEIRNVRSVFKISTKNEKIIMDSAKLMNLF